MWMKDEWLAAAAADSSEVVLPTSSLSFNKLKRCDGRYKCVKWSGGILEFPNGRRTSDEIRSKQIRKQRTSLFKRSFSLGLVPTPEPLSPGPQWSAMVLKDGLADEDPRGRCLAIGRRRPEWLPRGTILGRFLVCQLHKLQ